MTYDPKDVYAFEARPGQYILYPRYPVIQVREHQFMWTSDDRIQTMVFGKDSIRWGLIFSYPQIFYDSKEKKIVQVLKERDSPNRASALAELAALAENVERCRERIVALAESQRLATYDPKKPENNDDGLLMAIYEAERGLISAVRLLQRAARSR